MLKKLQKSKNKKMKGVQGNQAAQVRMFAHDAIPAAIGAINPDNGITLDSGGYNYSVGSEITLNTPSSGAAAKLKVTSVGKQEIINVQAVGGGKFYFDGVEAPTITLNRGTTYIFYQKASSNSSSTGHPLKFSETNDGTHTAGGTDYTDGVATVGTLGESMVITFTVSLNAPPTLFYYCQNHPNMGGQITIQDTGTDYAYTNTAVKSFEIIRQSGANPFGKGYTVGLKVQDQDDAPASGQRNVGAFIGNVSSIDLPSTTERGACIYIGVKMQDITLKMESGKEAKFQNVPGGTFMPVLAKEIVSANVDTGTLSDNNIIALY